MSILGLMTNNNNLPMRNFYYTGRDDILESIRRKLTESFYVVISGGGGYGKTQIAIEYAYRHDNDYAYVWFVNANSEINLQNSYRDFALRTGMPTAGEEKEFELVSRHVKRWFEEHQGLLFIYDSAEGVPLLQEYMPRATTTGHILITTRDGNQRIRGITNTVVDVFSPSDAVAFLQKYLAKNHKVINGNDALTLSESLGYLPLALEQVAAYMVETNVNVGQYLELLQTHGLEVFDELLVDYDKTILTVWNASFEQIAKDDEKDNLGAVAFLNICAYFAPDDIPLNMLIKGCDGLPQPLCDTLAPDKELIHNRLISKIARYSLMSMRRNNNGAAMLSINRMVKDVVTRNLTGDKKWISYALKVASKVFSYIYGDRKSMGAFKQNLPHVLEIAANTEKILFDNNEAMKEVALLLVSAGFGLYHDGEYAKSLVLYQKALAIFGRILGKEHINTAATYNNMALVYEAQADYSKALELYKIAVDISEIILGREHLYTATAYNNMAGVCYKQGEYEKALKWNQKAFIIYEKVLGKEHQDTAHIYNKMAGIYLKQGDYARALELYNEALAIREELLGEEHLSTAVTYKGIAGVYFDQGEYEKALKWNQKALVVYEELLYKEHPDTAIIYNNIAQVYYAQGEYEKSLGWYQKALAIYEKILGVEHPDTARTFSNIALVYNAQGEYAKALEFYRMSYMVLLAKLGEIHPYVITVKDNMEESFVNSGIQEPFEDWLSMEGRGQLSRITIKGFKSIKMCDVELRKVNVFIGANGAGKTNFISIFEMLSKVLARELSFYARKKGLDPLLYYGKGVTDSISAEFQFGSIVYSFDLEWTEADTLFFRKEQVFIDGKKILDEGGYAESKALNAIRNARTHTIFPQTIMIPRWRVFQFHDTSPSSQLKSENIVANCESLLHDASNLAAFLYRLQEKYSIEYKKIVRAIQRIAPYFEDFVLKPKEENNDQIVLRWRQKDHDGILLPSQLSDGTIRFICLVTLLLQPGELQPDTIIIDEPELGLHPYAIMIITDLVKKVAARKQIILATQSVELLDHFEAEDVVVVDRSGEGSKFKRLNAEQLAVWLDDDYTLGELWNKNLFGGRISR